MASLAGIFIFAFALLFSPEYKPFGLMFMSVYFIFGGSFFIYTISQKYGTDIPILFFIVVVSIFLLYLIVMPSGGKCGTPSAPLKSCFEQFELPESLQRSVKTGICTTDNNEWGMRIPKYGNKCVSTAIINRESKLQCQSLSPSNDGQSNDNTQPPEQPPLPPTQKQIDELYDKISDNTINIKQGTIKDGKYYNGITGCSALTVSQQPDSYFTKLCRTKYNSNNYNAVLPPTQCECPSNDKTVCENNIKYSADCYCELPKVIDTVPIKYTKKCQPMNGTNFDYECKSQYGYNYGYKNVLSHEDSCCPIEGMSRAVCSTNFTHGLSVSNSSTMVQCIATNDQQVHAEQCKKEYPNLAPHFSKVADIKGYNCPVGFFSSKCVYLHD